MSTDTEGKRAKFEGFRAEVRDKIDALVAEFANGELSREQFHAIYEHYNSQLMLIQEKLDANADDSPVQNAGQTIGIRQAHMGKAVGLMIYHNKSGQFVETLGQFDVPPQTIAPILNDFSLLMETRKLIDRRVVKIAERAWLLFAAGRYTTVVTLFHNEPSQQQSREIERLHHDFELANSTALTAGHIDSTRLAYPLLVFVQQKLKNA
ncbi:MAG: hypothetical protein GYB67_06220 [Chloroflexi bacterium]|nr:hypothetical protein [Chloroflexota bacterium]